jgi:ubiquinone/menaquinone biosynthesis C-methylase UbiE
MITKIQERYESESAGSCNLSCGNNIDFLDIRPGELILDLGCGRGAETIMAAELCGPEGKAIGLDITEAMIEAAKENAKAAGYENVEFVSGNIENLPFEANMFDAVMSNCVINHARDKYRVYEEINRVLKAGGRFVISDAVTKTPLPAEVKNDAEAWAQCYGGAVTEQEYFAGIQKAGFGNIEVLKRREYLKNGYDFISLTIKADKIPERR